MPWTIQFDSNDAPDIGRLTATYNAGLVDEFNYSTQITASDNAALTRFVSDAVARCNADITRRANIATRKAALTTQLVAALNAAKP